MKHAQCVRKRRRQARAQWSEALFGVKNMARKHKRKQAEKFTKKRQATELWSAVRKVLARGKPLSRMMTDAPLTLRKGTTLCLQSGEDHSLQPGVDSQRIYEQAGKTVCLEPSEAPVLQPWPGKAISLQPGEDASLQRTSAIESKIRQFQKVLHSRSHQRFPFHLVQYTNRDGSTHEVIQRVQYLNIFSFPTSQAPGHGEITEKGHVLKFQFIGGEDEEPFHCQDENDSLFFLQPQMQHDHLHGFSMTVSLSFSEMPQLKPCSNSSPQSLHTAPSLCG